MFKNSDNKKLAITKYVINEFLKKLYNQQMTVKVLFCSIVCSTYKY